MNFINQEKLKILKSKSFDNNNNFNDYLIKKNYNLKIIDYIKLIHNKFNNEIDLTFMDYFMSYIDKEETFCINAKMYYVFKTIITKKLKNEEIVEDDKDINSYKQSSNDINKTLNRSNLIEGSNFLLRHVSQQASKHGGNNKKIYLLTPNSFKKLLLDIYEHDVRIVFIDYYIFLEKCIKLYDMYQYKLQDNYNIKLLSQKDKEIDNLNNDINNLNINDKKFKKVVKEVVKKRNEDVNIKPSDKSKWHVFAILQDKININTLIFIRGQNKYITNKINKKSNGYNIVFNKTYHPNPTDLCVNVQKYFEHILIQLNNTINQNYMNKTISYIEWEEQFEDLKYYPPIKFKNTTFILNFDKLSLDNFITCINKINNRRYNLPYP